MRLDGHAERRTALTLLQAVSTAPCGPKRAAWAANLVHNPSFESGPDQWFGYGASLPSRSLHRGDGLLTDVGACARAGRGFTAGPVRGRPGSRSVLSAVLHGGDGSEGAGAMQVVQLQQAAAAPLLVRAWSRAANVTGERDAGYGVYVDINYVDGSHEWGWVRGLAQPHTAHWRCAHGAAPPTPRRSSAVHAFRRGDARVADAQPLHAAHKGGGHAGRVHHAARPRRYRVVRSPARRALCDAPGL